ncbi:hypothetical protein DENSPDRAFT_840089 [Dentipellis sp. KUC8613]|nr:hypothetical protein DENSPDRAFT_840089 [Dentipellis sp. KUC8613]
MLLPRRVQSPLNVGIGACGYNSPQRASADYMHLPMVITYHRSQTYLHSVSWSCDIAVQRLQASEVRMVP